MNRPAINKTDEWTTAMNDIINQNAKFRYQLLGRMKSDCEYYLGYGNRHPNRLWAQSEEQQIEMMLKLHDSFKEDEKPVWLTLDEILSYSKKMITTK